MARRCILVADDMGTQRENWFEGIQLRFSEGSPKPQCVCQIWAYRSLG